MLVCADSMIYPSPMMLHPTPKKASSRREMARRNRDKEPVVRLSLLYHHPPLSFLVLARQAWFPTQGAARIVHPSEAASLTVPLFTSTSTSTSQSTSKSAHTSHTPTPTPPNLGLEAIHPAHDKSSSILSRPALPFITLVVDGVSAISPTARRKWTDQMTVCH